MLLFMQTTGATRFTWWDLDSCSPLPDRPTSQWLHLTLLCARTGFGHKLFYVFFYFVTSERLRFLEGLADVVDDDAPSPSALEV